MAKPEQLFHNLLVTAPNGGGLLAIRQARAEFLDRQSSTGLACAAGRCYRVLQPATLVCRGLDPYERQFPGLADLHDVLPSAEGCLTVVTEENAVVAIDHQGRMTRRWVMPGEPDSRHLNSLAVWQDRVVFAAFGDYERHRGYKAGTLGLGYVQDLHSGRRYITGLSQPHSLVPLGSELLLADSERLALALYDARGRRLRQACFDGYTRGLAIRADVLYLGLSASRNSVAHQAEQAALLALDRGTWRVLGRMPLPVREVYAILAIDDDAAMHTLMSALAMAQGEGTHG